MGSACCRRPGPPRDRLPAPHLYTQGSDLGDLSFEEKWLRDVEVDGLRESVVYEPRAVFRDDFHRHPCSPRSAFLAKACTFCCCGACLCPLLLYLLIVTLTNFTVYGTTFTYSGYLQPVWSYLLAGMADNVTLAQWYAGIAAAGDASVGNGPGSNTQMYFGWHEVRVLLADFYPRIRNHSMKRYSEMGVSVQNKLMWPETGTSIMGYTQKAHAVVRPLLAGVLDKALEPNQECDGSACWNGAWLRRIFRARFEHTEVLSSRDLAWIVSSVLHKVLLNLDISDDDARNFSRFLPVFAFPQPLPPVMAASPLAGWLFDMQGVLDVKARLVKEYKRAIRKKWQLEDWDARSDDLVLLASAMVDTLALAGGLTVPSALDHMLALLFMQDGPSAQIRPADLEDQTVLHDFIIEALRLFPPVAGVPRWITDDSGDTWAHQILNVGQALQDPNVFPQPHEFRLGRPGLNHADLNRSIGWADFALVGEDVSHPDSHACPGKLLSLQLMAAFLSEFVRAGPWQADDPAGIRLNMYASSGYTLRKQRQQQRQAAPSHRSSSGLASSSSGVKPSGPLPAAPVPPLFRFCNWLPSLCHFVSIPIQCLEAPCGFA